MTRDEARLLRKEILSQDRAAMSRSIVDHLLRWPCYQSARTVMAYAPVGSEVDIWPLLSDAISKGKRLLLPRCFPGGSMEAAVVCDLHSLVPGALRIPTPAPDAPFVPKAEIDLILAPGLLFDGTGNRLGQGAGYYDRFLADFRGMTCGVAFSHQVVPNLVVLPHDVPVLALATERGVFIVRDGAHH